MHYDQIRIFTKKGNLIDYLHTDKVSSRFPNVEHAEQYYGKETEIQLIACVRWENFPVSTRNGIVQRPKCFCKIKCPVNPLPIKGEFELPSLDSLHAFLKANGWSYHKTIYSWMFE